MELFRLNITPTFIQERTRLTWREVLLGIDYELLSPGAAVDLAADQLTVQDDATPTLVELAGLDRGERTRDLVEQLAAAEPQQDPKAMRSKWLYLSLAWIFDHKDSYSDPLRSVEEVYADFDYPDAIRSFIRYMPMDEPDLGSREANEGRLFKRWKHYLEDASSEFRP